MFIRLKKRKARRDEQKRIAEEKRREAELAAEMSSASDKHSKRLGRKKTEENVPSSAKKQGELARWQLVV